MNDKEWLASLKVGDEVSTGDSIGVVERMTPTQLVIKTQGGSEMRFNRVTGRRVGELSPWAGNRWLFELNPEAREKFERARLADWFRGIRVENLSLEQLRAVRAVLVPVAAGKGEPS